MEGDPHPGAMRGRMSFQSFNPSLDVSILIVLLWVLLKTITTSWNSVLVYLFCSTLLKDYILYRCIHVCCCFMYSVFCSSVALLFIMFKMYNFKHYKNYNVFFCLGRNWMKKLVMLTIQKAQLHLLVNKTEEVLIGWFLTILCSAILFFFSKFSL